jgi:hypothetical protein
MARQKRQTNYVGFRASEEMLGFLRARQEEGEGLGAVARRQLEFYQALLARGLQEIRALQLSHEEALRILEALNGILITPETTPLLWAEVAQRLGDEDPTVKKVRSLSPAGIWALADVAARFWRGDREVLKEILKEERP